jgi:hypothetical protein
LERARKALYNRSQIAYGTKRLVGDFRSKGSTDIGNLVWE